MDRVSFNMKDRKVLYGILVIVLVSVFTLSVAYAALNAVLTISGSAQVSSADWDVHFDNIQVTSGSVSGENPKITSPTTTTFSTTLNMPGDFYEFSIDVVNDGSIDAMIENITKTPTLSANQAKYLKYEITYQNGESITTNQLVEKDSFVRLKVRVEYRSDITSPDLPTSSETLNLGLQLDYIQSDNSGSSVTDNGIKIIEFSINDKAYYATLNMTWEDWVNSSYNTDGFYLPGNDMVYSATGNNIFSVTYNDIIASGGIYDLSEVGAPDVGPE